LRQEQEFTDKSVVANKEYQYRVTAENEGGESKPSEPSDPIKAKPLRGLTRLPLPHFDNLYSLDVIKPVANKRKKRRKLN